MATERNHSTEKTAFLGGPLISWPLTLIGLTLALLLVANSVSAWGQRDGRDIEDIKSHAEYFVGRALDRLDATDDQSAAIQIIVAASIDDLQNARGDSEAGREQLRALVRADSIDRDALETIRRSHLERADEMSRIVADGLADIIDILTPEQRQELEEHLDKHQGRHGRHGWGWH